MIETMLVERLSVASEPERRAAAQEIGESEDPEAVAVLMAQLRRESSRVVKEALLRGVSRLWNSDQMDAIIQLLKDDDPFVRAEAAEMLLRRASDAIEGLTKLMKGTDRDLRKFSVEIMSQSAIGVPDALYELALQDEDVNVVVTAVENIGSGRRTSLSGQVAEVALRADHPMVICACFETLAMIGTNGHFEALRAKFPNAAKVSGLYLQPYLKFLGGTAGPSAIEEICATIEAKGAFVYQAAIDALNKIAIRHGVGELNPSCEGVLCGLLARNPEAGMRFQLIRLLGKFTQSREVAMTLLPFIEDPDRAFALSVVESLANSADPEVNTALRVLLSRERDPEIAEELEEILGRRPRWNSPAINSAS